MSAMTRWTTTMLGAVAVVAACSADPVNLALGKRYTFSTTPTYRYCTDPGDFVQLTDGLHSTESSALWLQKGTVGWNRVKSAEGAQMITVDLGESCPISGFAYTLAAGCADVSWPTAIGVYVSEDKESWICLGDLWARSTSRTGAPKFDSYSVYRAFDDAMPCRGRYVAFLHFASGMGFCDEVEVFAGDEKTTNPSDARIVVNPFADKFRMQLHGFLASDAVRLGVAPPKMDVPDGMKAGALRTELPLSAEHAALWAKNASRLRSAGFSAPVFWKSNRWGNLDPLAIPSKDSASEAPLEVEMMRGETRSETINILNPTDAPIDFTVTVEGLPEAAHVDCREVLFTIGIGANGQWFGTASSALRPGHGASVSFSVPAGVSKQVWISFARPSGVAGTFKGVVRAVGGNATLSCPIVLKLHDLDFPCRPRIHVGGWDYLNDGARYCGKTEMNAAHKRAMLAMYTDTAWGSQAVFPKNALFDKEGNLTNALDFTALDGWVANWPEARMFAAFYCAMPGVHFFGEAAGTPRFNRMVGAYFRAFYDHARKISGGREVIVLTQDEPSSRKSSENAVLWNAPIRAAVPGLKVFVDPVYEDAAKVPQDLVDSADILCPFRPYFSRKGQREAWRKMAGPGTARELQLYSCLVGSRGLDPEGYYRGQFWDAFRMGATGSFFWQFGCGAGSGSFAAFGQSHPECSPYFAGMTATDVMPSKQSEGVREGVEDHELLALLGDAANAIRAKGGDTRKIDEFLASAVSRAVDEKETADERFVRMRSRFDVVRIEALRLLSSTMPQIADLVRLGRLIEIPSVSSNVVEVNRAVDFLAGELVRDGLWCRIETMDDGRRVLFAANVENARPDILLSAHLDVVSAIAPAQFIPCWECGRIYGRGASDCKEHVVLCARLMRELKGKVSIGAIFGSDEEIGGASTAFMLDKGYGASKMVVVLDSEQFAITTRQKGLARYVVESAAPPSHAGMVKGAPPNAVGDLIKSYEVVAAKIPDYEDGSWRDVLMLERVTGTRHHAEMELSVRCAKFGGFERIENLLRDKFGRDLRCLRKGEAVWLDETQPYLVEFRERMRRKWPRRKIDFFHLNSSTDARHLQRLGLPMLILGVDARGAHTATEYVVISSLDEYADLITEYLTSVN